MDGIHDFAMSPEFWARYGNVTIKTASGRSSVESTHHLLHMDRPKHAFQLASDDAHEVCGGTT